METMKRSVIGISNQKGGVGKTTTAINLAAALGSSGHKTLLIDIDPQGNASSGVGIDKDNLTATMYEVLLGLIPIREAIYSTAFPNLSVIPANMNLIGASLELQEMDERETRLRRMLQEIERDYDIIILDPPPSLGMLSLNVLVAAEWLVIPVQCEYYALEGLKILQEAIERIRGRFNPDLEILGILLTMYDGRTNLSRQVTEEVRRFFANKVFTSVIYRSVRLGEAPSYGKPIMYYDERSAGTLCYQLLSEEVMQRLNGKVNIPDAPTMDTRSEEEKGAPES